MLRWGLMIAALMAAPVSRAEDSPAGLWDSPLGRLRVDTSGEGWTAVLVEPAAGSCLHASKGAEVLKGQLQDDTFSGEVRLCLEGADCVATDSWLNVLLLVDSRTGQLTGAVERGNEGCHAKLPRTGAFTLRRHRAAPPRPPPGVDPAKQAAARQLLSEGATLMGDGRFEVARERFEKSIALAPLPEAYNGVGVTYYARKQYDEALKAYKQALVVDPGFGDAYYNMGCIYALTQRKELAFRYLRLATRNGYKALEELEGDHDLDSLHSDPRFKDLRKRYTPGG